MTGKILGFELNTARKILIDAGYTVEEKELSSKKGMPGNEKRVIRVRFSEGEAEKRAQILYSQFQTEIE